MKASAKHFGLAVRP